MAHSTTEASPFSPLRWRGDTLELLDQTLLPGEETWIACPTPEEVSAAIYRLSVRGAPAIGVAAAYGLVVGLTPPPAEEEIDGRFDSVAELLGKTRPTAVNLRWAIERGREVFTRQRSQGASPAEVRAALLAWAQELHAKDIETNRRMGEHGATLFEGQRRVLTHCNAGALATAGIGTAIGVIAASFARGGVGMVWVDETRPLLQGARLTSWELQRLGIPFKLVTDNSVGALMSGDHVDGVVVGADRIAANGDTANKIGTYTVAVLAHRHGVPFYVAAPLSTIDRATASGDGIPIEERAGDEVTSVGGTVVAPEETQAFNLAFDVTPAELIAGIVTEQGVLRPPYVESIRDAFKRAQRERS
jgi:methylthioribose-1-phosphate isomerase